MHIEELKKILLEKDLVKLKNALENYQINECDKFGNTILHYYLKTKKNEDIPVESIIELFIEKGININQKQKDKQFGFSPLHLSVNIKNLEAFNYLIERGADINAQDVNGNTVLSSAVFNYNRDIDIYGEMITKLIDKGANINLKNNHNVSAHSLANSMVSDVKKFFR
ncbi:ankyrin repeat domain-containing protein [Capnocytophaga canimorsus]|uniref:ankyrin repeat domain-containing protein n=1 Tax=Capnocytophaga canimorsus TaxID=28188 RepID=UPI001AC8DB34|nr:ankyrin repeat domain-containing protein [Capnocytophaga canimorsus]GIM56717.1 hypothetical protein CAPN006_11110 [Capnocytophaga canimorsus]GJQ05641.1 hypothetical protein CAPN009_20560 [Capnocytophaga canimorsus]